MTVLSQDPHPELADIGGATAAKPDTGPLLPVFVLDEYEGRDVKRVQDCSREELDRWVEANAAAVREHLPADLLVCNHVLLGGPVGVASRCAVRRQGARLRAGVLHAREPRAREVGARRPRARARSGRRLGAHQGGPGRGLRLRGRGARDPAGRRRRRLEPAAPRGGARGSARGGAKRPAEPGERERAAARRGERRAARGLPRGRHANGGLLRQAPLQQGRPPPARGDERDRRPRGDRRLRRLPRRARGARRSRHARSSPGRSSTGTWSTCSPSRMHASSPRSSRRRSGWSRRRRRRRAARHWSRTTPGSPRSREGLAEDYPPELG